MLQGQFKLVLDDNGNPKEVQGTFSCADFGDMMADILRASHANGAMTPQAEAASIMASRAQRTAMHKLDFLCSALLDGMAVSDDELEAMAAAIRARRDATKASAPTPSAETRTAAETLVSVGPLAHTAEEAKAAASAEAGANIAAAKVAIAKAAMAEAEKAGEASNTPHNSDAHWTRGRAVR